MAEFTGFRPSSVKINFSGFKYHVFLSFRGPDVRTSFVDHLFQAFKSAGIHAFLDNERLEKGKSIELSLEAAIQNSAVLIPIFSSGYADSTWCLQEARQMWKCRSRGLIIPLFYGVDPSSVRYPLKEKGTYAEAFKKHYSKANLPGRFESQVIDEWREALHYISSLSGWSLYMAAGYEAKLVKQVVSDMTALNCVPRPLPGNSVGLEQHVWKMKEMLDLNVTDTTIRLGIWGIGGIGKTTLSEAIFNEFSSTFEASCFLSDIRSAHERHGIIGLQAQMLKDLSNVEVNVNDINHGKSLLQFHLGSIRALVVLDNVDHRRQFDSFMLDCCAPGSRVIVTSRDRHVLELRMPPENVYELQGLRQDEALELFCWHAFKQAHPYDSYQELSTKIIKASGGVPLTLEVLGAFLSGRETSDKCWIEALRMLENLTDPDIFEPLKISYDSLLPSEKEIFLDIACLFIGQDREEPSIFWEELGLDVEITLRNLQHKLLLKIDAENKLRMHDLIRDLGRRIVADESPGNPGRRSRLWKQEDVHNVITQKLGTEKVKYLVHAQEGEGIKLKKNSLASMNGLRYLCFKDTIVKESDTSELPPDLKWLKWERCPLEVLPHQWKIKNVVILDVSSTSISHGNDLRFSLRQLWNDQSNRKMLKHLRVLRVNWCPSLQRLPALSIPKSLFKLDLTGCSQITQLPDSFGLLTQLYYLELSGCSRLEKLPDCLGNLLELKQLGLAECSSLKSLPCSIGCLQKLQSLNLSRCGNLEQLPSSIKKLSCLQKLFISYCSNLSKLPDNLEDLSSLKILELKDVFEIKELPRSIGSLSRLEKLDLEYCLIVALPPSVGYLKHLRCLNMNNCDFLYVIPDEICGLESLEEFLLNRCENLTTLPRTISKLQCLVRFEAGYCDLKSIPQSFAELSSLKILHLEDNKFSTLPLSSALFSPLTELVLCECTELVELPNLPEGLVKLDIEGCATLEILPEMSHLKRMQMLRFARCPDSVQCKILWQIRELTTMQITVGHGSGETLRLTEAVVGNACFMRVYKAMIVLEIYKERLQAFIELVKFLIKAQNGFQAEHLRDMDSAAESWKAEGPEAEHLEGIKGVGDSWKGGGPNAAAEHKEDKKSVAESWKARVNRVEIEKICKGVLESWEAEHLDDMERVEETWRVRIRAGFVRILKGVLGSCEREECETEAEGEHSEVTKRVLKSSKAEQPEAELPVYPVWEDLTACLSEVKPMEQVDRQLKRWEAGAGDEVLVDFKRVGSGWKAVGFKAEHPVDTVLEGMIASMSEIEAQQMEYMERVLESWKAEEPQPELLGEFRRVVESWKAVGFKHQEDLKQMMVRWTNIRYFGGLLETARKSLEDFTVVIDQGLLKQRTQCLSQLRESMVQRLSGIADTFEDEVSDDEVFKLIIKKETWDQNIRRVMGIIVLCLFKVIAGREQWLLSVSSGLQNRAI